MAPLSAAPSPLQPRSPSLQNISNSAKSPIGGRSLPLRKPSLKPPLGSPARQSTAQHKQPKEIPGPSPAKQTIPQKRKPPPTHDQAESMNEAIARKYIKGPKLGEGTYAVVFKGHLSSDPSHVVAIKKFKIVKEMSQNGLAPDTLREIKYLQELSHTNIVKLHDVYSSKDQNINMVIEFFECGNLEELIKDINISYGLPDIKAWMGMLLRAIYFCHSNFVLHRDIKPGNLLISSNGELKLADFGLASSFGAPERRMTANVITLWYRPPELLFGARHYSGAVDIWSIGMIFAELLVRRPWCAYAPENEEQFARGGGELGQIDLINKALGTPCEEVWQGVSKLPSFVEQTPKVPLRDKRFFQSQFTMLDETGLELLRGMLTLDPRKRPSAKESLLHAWWGVEPRPTDREALPRARNVDEKEVGKELALKPGVVDEKFKGVARKLDFGAARG